MTNKFTEKKILAELLDELYGVVDSRERDASLKYEPVGEEQARDWKKGGELMWEDEAHTIPKMTTKWDYVPRTDDEMGEEQKIRIKMCKFIKTQLEKMI